MHIFLQTQLTGGYKAKLWIFWGPDAIFENHWFRCNRLIRTVYDPGHPPQPQQDQKTHAIKGVLTGNVNNVQDEGHHHHNPIKHLKLVLEKLQLVGVQLHEQLHHEEGQEGQAEVVEHLQEYPG